MSRAERPRRESDCSAEPGCLVSTVQRQGVPEAPSHGHRHRRGPGTPEGPGDARGARGTPEGPGGHRRGLGTPEGSGNAGGVRGTPEGPFSLTRLLWGQGLNRSRSAPSHEAAEGLLRTTKFREAGTCLRTRANWD